MADQSADLDLLQLLWDGYGSGRFAPLPSLAFNEMQINEFHKSKKTSLNQLNIPTCEQSRSVMIDVIILIIVIGAFEFLQYPYFKALVHNTVEIGREVVDVIREEIVRAPVVFGCLGVSILFATIALVAIMVCTYRKFGKPGCRGLQKAAEFDKQLETKECVKRSTFVAKNGLKKGLFQLPRDHRRELKVELKKMAPPNARPEGHVFKADLLGLKKEKVKVEVVEGNILQISGEMSRDKEEKNDTWHCIKRSSGKFLRRFRLPENAEMDQIKASMVNEVLTVTVPKEEVKKPYVKAIAAAGDRLVVP
ncbi:Uncharacterized protein Fot_05207 [Forsythia ovata]|uniref:SHSP domain-containing protein n=1 Tax=Forsythia ovata TaxID=205694 RepID=A0ABD1WSA8_9LAMI